MLYVLKKLQILFVLSLCLALPACLQGTAGDDGSSSNATKGTKSATITIEETSLQSSARESISSTDNGDFLLSDQIIGSETLVVITLLNTGDVPAEKIKAFSLSTPLSYAGGSYPGTGGTCTKKISSQETCAIVVTFSPNKMGLNTATLQLGYYNGKITRTFEKIFKGNGISSPALTVANPSRGRLAGGGTLTISGSQIYTSATVTVGGENCAVTAVSEPSSLTCVLAAHAAGAVDIVLTNTDGQSATLSGGYTYQPAPTVSSVSLSYGPLAGSQSVTVTGTGFVSGISVDFGGSTCSNPAVLSSTTLTCTTSAHSAGNVIVTVTNADSQYGSANGIYTYQVGPTVTVVSPTAGALAGGTSLSITGTGFITGSTVTVGGVTCSSPTVNSATNITCTSGAHAAATVDIIVTTPDLQTGTGSSLYSYQQAPTVTASFPSRIYISGRQVNLVGTGFVTGATATVNGSACTSPVVNSSTSLTCTVGSNATGTYSIVVTNADTQTGTLSNGITVADNDVWIPTTTVGAPSARRVTNQVVWTGSKMLLWAGWPWNSSNYSAGHSFDPITNSWAVLNNTNMTQIREAGATTIWTGSKMIIWAGYGTGNHGGMYDPVLDSWTLMTTTNAPPAASPAFSVWTGSKMLTWSGWYNWGVLSNGAGIFDPETNTWSAMNTVGAPELRYRGAAVWTGSKMIVWGGYNNSITLNTGGIYDPASDTWASMTTTGAPSPRNLGAYYWTGSKMLVWGPSDGGLYDPINNSWTAISTVGISGYWSGFTSVWTGSQLMIWGGSNTGAIYTPETNSWASTTTNGAPSTTTNASLGVATGYSGGVASTVLYSAGGVWTGSRMIVWGGSNHVDSYVVNTGGIYIPPTDPASNTWTTMSTTGAPSVRSFPAAVWTGSKMLIWGGVANFETDYLNTGASYDPVTNSWTAMTTTGAPSPRTTYGVWAGNKMVVAFGHNGTVYFNDGGLYDPALNSWTAMETTGAPSIRVSHSAVWTGHKMLAWGGWNGTNGTNTGGIFDPSSNSWSAMATTSAFATTGTATVWTGHQMIIWGGLGAGNTGAVYTPATNLWSTTTTLGAPIPLAESSVVWTGNKMIIWGGYGGATGYNNVGGKYDPSANSWQSITTLNAPEARRTISYSIWTGSNMVVWGGVGSGGGSVNTGGSYEPNADSWTTLSTTNAPLSRYEHTAIWTGSKMLIFGGNRGTSNSGGLYTP